MESVALKAAMIMPSLLLQKSHRSSKAKDHVAQLERRLKSWESGDIDCLLQEGRTIQKRLTSSSNKFTMSDEHLARSFSNLMMVGKVKAALRLITNHSKGGLLPLDSLVATTDSSPETVRQSLLKKHPPGEPLKPSAICTPDPTTLEPHHVIFDQIDGSLIRTVALRTEGAAGPSGIDASGWKRLCTSFRTLSVDLCNALALLARRICTTLVDPDGLAAFVSCRLIALDKCPGVRPIGVGETARRIVGRAISFILRQDVQTAAGPIQLCAGHEGGCEAAVHAMRHVFCSPDTDAMILVDASNAFNSLNRQTALRNIQHLCPPLAKVIINTYRSDIELFIDGETILSREGTTQGDPLAMAMYAISTAPLIHRLSNDAIKQVWYADDATAGGGLRHLRQWWDHLSEIGPDYGYYPNASKTCLIVKEEKLPLAASLFEGTGVSIAKDGKRHLGAALGSDSFVKTYVCEKVATWVQEVERLSSIAITQPQSAFAAFTHGLTSKWSYLSRTIPDIGNLLQPLEDAIRLHFLPKLTGQNPFNDTERELMALPARLGGLGISNPVDQAPSQHRTSIAVTTPLVDLILQQATVIPAEVTIIQNQAKAAAHKDRRQAQSTLATDLCTRLPSSLQRAVESSKECGASSWLTALPISEHGFDLHKGAFRDALCLRYGWQPPLLPAHCVCGKQFSVDHALSCPCGGFPSIRHNEIRNITAHLMSEVCHNVGIEPLLQPLSGESLEYRSANREDGARLDVMSQGFWAGDRQCAFFDVRVFNPFAHSNRNHACYRRHEQEKRRSYDQRVRDVEHGIFSPLVFSTAGGMGPTAKVVYKKLASMLAAKHSQPYSLTLNWLRCRLCFSLLRSSIMCLRGSRSVSRPASSTLSEAAVDCALSDARVAPSS